MVAHGHVYKTRHVDQFKARPPHVCTHIDLKKGCMVEMQSFLYVLHVQYAAMNIEWAGFQPVDIDHRGHR